MKTLKSSPPDVDKNAGQETDENVLIVQCQTGDQKAFRQIYERYKQKVYRIAFQFFRDMEIAEDVTQDTFVRVFRGISKFDGRGSFFSWLYSIVRYLCIDRARRRKRAAEVEYDDEVRHSCHEDQNSIVDPHTKLQRGRWWKNLDLAIRKLPPIHQQAVLLYIRDGLTYEEIAVEAQCPKGTIMSRIFQGRKKLKMLMGDSFFDLIKDEDAP